MATWRESIGGVLLDGNYADNPMPKKPEGEPEAFCDSITCICNSKGIKYQETCNLGYLRVQKFVSKTTMFCPDCGSALFWRRTLKSEKYEKWKTKQARRKKRASEKTT